MSIPQICPNCENHISMAHAPDCCYGTPEYAHLGWPSEQRYIIDDPRPVPNKVDSITWTPPTMEELSKDGFIDSASAIRRLLAYLQEEENEAPLMQPEPMEELAAPKSSMMNVVYRLAERSEELRKEAAGMYNIEARAKRNFAADVLDRLVEDLA